MSQVSPEARANLSEFLGESLEKSSSGFESALKTMLFGLVDITKTAGSADSIAKVIKDGGHSGDLIDDLSNLFGKKDKLQLLVTIGKNINTHFFQTNLDKYAQDISAESGVSKSSALSLLSLAAPLVLGKLGKNIRTNGWTNQQFTAAMLHEGETSSFQSTVVAEAENHEALPDERTVITERKSTKDSNLGWLAWLFLVLLGLSALYYTFKGRIDGGNPITRDSKASSEQVSVDSSAQTNADEMFEALNPDRNKNDNSAQTTESSSAAIEERTSASSENSKSDTNGFVGNTSENTKKSNSTSAPVSTNTARSKGIQRNSSTGYPSRSNPNDLPPVSTPDNRPMSSKLRSSGFIGINGLSYKYASAEIVSEGSISQLVKYLQANPSATIEVKGGGGDQELSEDRAYALKGLLYQKGIPSGRVQISRQKSTDGPVVIKVNP
ncbi:DUF937 domain-containing protein [Jiulongibacter sediminis]|nr:DUF937 domain-containing protein [Jiulongibacter sediminis]